jgi:thiamine kinase-like enzyme
MDQVKQILESTFHRSDWQFSKPPRGASKESYLAENDDMKVFVKLDVTTRALSTLSDLGVTPKVLGSGQKDDTSYVIQEFIEGTHPDEKWFQDHIAEVAQLFRTYHDSQSLADELREPKHEDYRKFLRDSVDFLDFWLELIKAPFVDKASITKQIDQLRQMVPFLPETTLVPTHADPNPANFINTKENIYMIDWDDISLCDETRDISLLLQRYVPKDAHSKFFASYGKTYESMKERYNFWLAHGSLCIVFWLADRREEEPMVSFLNDVKQALDNLALKQ